MDCHATSDLLLFATATRGSRSGGWNARSTSANLFLPFSPEKVWSYETSAKSEWLERRLRVNTRLFAGLRNRGIELKLQAMPLPGVQGCGQGLVTVAGAVARPVRSPRVTASLGGSYAIVVGSSGSDRNYVQSTTSNYSYLNSPGRSMVRFKYRFGGGN